MSNFVILGGAGYIGSVLSEELSNNPDNHVTVVDNLMYKQCGLLHLCHRKNFNMIRADVRNTEALDPILERADFILPLAAIVGAPACDRDEELAASVNYDHIKHVADKFGQKKIIYPNSNSGYGSGQGTAYCTEESPMKPLSLYGQTKCDAERCVLGAGGVALRLATVFGLSPRMRLDLLVNDFTYKAMTDGYIVLFEKDFKRNYIHVRDVVGAFVFVMENYDACRGNAYNVGLSSANLSKYELAMKIKEHIPFAVHCDDIKEDPDKRNYLVSNEKLEKLGWRPKYSLDDGIEELKKGYSMLFAGMQRFTNL